jgi:hypothetical protein
LVEPPQQSTFMLRPLWSADVSRDDVIEQAFASKLGKEAIQYLNESPWRDIRVVPVRVAV